MSSSEVQVRFVPRRTSGMLNWVRAAPSQKISTSAMSSGRFTVMTTSLISARRSSLRSRSLEVFAAQSFGRSRARRVNASRSARVSGAGRACSSAASVRCSRATSASASSSLRSNVRATSRFSGSHASNCRSARCASNSARSSASRCPASRAPCCSVSSAIAPVLAGDPGRGDCLEERRGDSLVEPAAPEGLARRLRAVKMQPAHARIPHTATVVAGIHDLHPPAAPSAAQQPLQQRATLTSGAAALAAGSHVRPQALAVGEVLLPRDIARMVIGQADRPLLDRDLKRPNVQRPVGVDVLLLAGAAEHERAGMDRVGQQLVDRAIARTDPSRPLTVTRSHMTARMEPLRVERDEQQQQARKGDCKYDVFLASTKAHDG
jgi:hypothetical protein